MSDTAAHLVDRVLPEVPVRQSLISLPYSLRYRLLRRRVLLRQFICAVFGDGSRQRQ